MRGAAADTARWATLTMASQPSPLPPSFHCTRRAGAVAIGGAVWGAAVVTGAMAPSRPMESSVPSGRWRILVAARGPAAWSFEGFLPWMGLAWLSIVLPL